MCQEGRWEVDFIRAFVENDVPPWGHQLYVTGQGWHQQFHHPAAESGRAGVHQYTERFMQSSEMWFAWYFGLLLIGTPAFQA